MAEEKLAFTPQNLWNKAVKTVRGENTAQLVEQFTSEMTLVAEGLCEDQNKLHNQMEELNRFEDARFQKIENSLSHLDTRIDEILKQQDEITAELRTRLSVLEKTKTSIQPKKADKKPLIAQLTVPVAIIAGAWVLVTLMHLISAAL